MDKIEKNKGLALPSREYLHECVEGKRRKKMLNFFLYSDKKKTFLCKYVDKKKMMEQWIVLLKLLMMAKKIIHTFTHTHAYYLIDSLNDKEMKEKKHKQYY